MARTMERVADRQAREQRRRQAAASALEQRRQFERNPAVWLQRALQNRDEPEGFASSAMRRLAARGRALGSRVDVGVYLLLVERVSKSRTLARALDRPDGLDVALGCQSLAKEWRFWLRSLDSWQPLERTAEAQFAGLARHLLAAFPTPAVLDSLLLLQMEGCSSGWFRHVAQGGSLREAPGLTVPLTRRMTHEALAAPARLSFVEAVRWGQVIASGGDHALAQAAANTHLGRQLEDVEAEEFWQSVLLWAAGRSDLCPEQLGLIVDFLQARRFGDGVLHPGPDAEFAIKGRSVRALMELVRQWHRELNRIRAEAGAHFSKDLPVRFDSCGLGEWRLVRRKPKETWTITEILTLQALAEEGREMRHCVLSYGHRIAHGNCSIWSLRRRPGGNGPEERVLTIEVVLPGRLVVQARGKLNRLPTASEQAVLEEWARDRKLVLRC